MIEINEEKIIFGFLLLLRSVLGTFRGGTWCIQLLHVALRYIAVHEQLLFEDDDVEKNVIILYNSYTLNWFVLVL